MVEMPGQLMFCAHIDQAPAGDWFEAPGRKSPAAVMEDYAAEALLRSNNGVHPAISEVARLFLYASFPQPEAAIRVWTSRGDDQKITLFTEACLAAMYGTKLADANKFVGDNIYAVRTRTNAIEVRRKGGLMQAAQMCQTLGETRCGLRMGRDGSFFLE